MTRSYDDKIFDDKIFYNDYDNCRRRCKSLAAAAPTTTTTTP
jgi:hypothetical protein